MRPTKAEAMLAQECRFGFDYKLEKMLDLQHGSTSKKKRAKIIAN